MSFLSGSRDANPQALLTKSGLTAASSAQQHRLSEQLACPRLSGRSWVRGAAARPHSCIPQRVRDRLRATCPRGRPPVPPLPSLPCPAAGPLNSPHAQIAAPALPLPPPLPPCPRAVAAIKAMLGAAARLWKSQQSIAIRSPRRARRTRGGPYANEREPQCIRGPQIGITTHHPAEQRPESAACHRAAGPARLRGGKKAAALAQAQYVAPTVTRATYGRETRRPPGARCAAPFWPEDRRRGAPSRKKSSVSPGPEAPG